MIRGLTSHVFSIPVRAGEVVEVFDGGRRLKVKTDADRNAKPTTEIALTRGRAILTRPKVGDYLVEYPTGHIDILGPVEFAAKVASGGPHVT